jgi:hypothetical protein
VGPGRFARGRDPTRAGVEDGKLRATRPRDLNARINQLEQDALLYDPAAKGDLHRIREQRNKLAHETQSASWGEVDKAVQVIASQLGHLGLM